MTSSPELLDYVDILHKRREAHGRPSARANQARLANQFRGGGSRDASCTSHSLPSHLQDVPSHKDGRLREFPTAPITPGDRPGASLEEGPSMMDQERERVLGVMDTQARILRTLQESHRDMDEEALLGDVVEAQDAIESVLREYEALRPELTK